MALPGDRLRQIDAECMVPTGIDASSAMNLASRLVTAENHLVAACTLSR